MLLGVWCQHYPLCQDKSKWPFLSAHSLEHCQGPYFRTWFFSPCGCNVCQQICLLKSSYPRWKLVQLDLLWAVTSVSREASTCHFLPAWSLGSLALHANHAVTDLLSLGASGCLIRRKLTCMHDCLWQEDHAKTNLPWLRSPTK